MNVRAKCSAVNSVFLVQLRKNSADDSRGFLVGQENCLSIRAMRWGVLFRWRAASGQNCLPRRGDCPQGMHRKCRKAVLSSQFGDATGSFCVAGSCSAHPCYGVASIYRNYPSGSWLRRAENSFQHGKFFLEVDLMNIDPVCGMKVDEKNAPARSEYNGKTFTFCSEECKKRFDQSPEQYAQRVA